MEKYKNRDSGNWKVNVKIYLQGYVLQQSITWDKINTCYILYLAWQITNQLSVANFSIYKEQKKTFFFFKSFRFNPRNLKYFTVGGFCRLILRKCAPGREHFPRLPSALMGGETCGLLKTSSCRTLEILTHIPHFINDRSQRSCLDPPYVRPVREENTGGKELGRRDRDSKRLMTLGTHKQFPLCYTKVT